MKSALPLPRYVKRKRLKSGIGYFFVVPSWALARCPLKSQPLGIDYAKAVHKAETVLLPQFDTWLKGMAVDTNTSAIGSLDWLIAEYRVDRRYQRLEPRSQRNHENGFRLVANHLLNDGRRLGTFPVSLIRSNDVDALYETLLTVKKTGRKRRTTVNHAMRSLRRAWNVCYRRHPNIVPLINPFRAMGLEGSSKETPTASLTELQAFRKTAKDMGLHSLATAALLAFEMLPRVQDVFATFCAEHYRPKSHPDAVCVLHPKTGEENWFPLFDDSGTPLFPELMAELDALKQDRIAGLMFRRDWNQKPWPTIPREGEIDLTHMHRMVKRVIRAAGLRSELTFTSFRHGGFTEAADSDLTDAEMRALGRHKSAKVLPKYAKRTMKQVAAAVSKRRAARTEPAQNVGMACGNEKEKSG